MILLLERSRDISRIGQIAARLTLVHLFRRTTAIAATAAHVDAVAGGFSHHDRTSRSIRVQLDRGRTLSVLVSLLEQMLLASAVVAVAHCCGLDHFARFTIDE